MPLMQNGERIYTAHASKNSKVGPSFFEVHTSVLVPLLVIPLAPFSIVIKTSFFVILVMILLERRGWTIGIALRRIRARMAGRYRFRKTRSLLVKRMKGN